MKKLTDDFIRSKIKSYSWEVDLQSKTVKQLLEILKNIEEDKGYNSDATFYVSDGSGCCSFCYPSPSIYLERRESFEDCKRRLEEEQKLRSERAKLAQSRRKKNVTTK